MLQELIKYLTELRKDANRLERTNINNEEKKDFLSIYGMKILYTLIALFFLFFLKEGFSNDFVSFIASILSILVGLFITALIFSFDKFYNPSKKEYPNSMDKLWDTQSYNYYKKFSYLTSYTIVLSIFTLLLLSINVLFQSFSNINIFKTYICIVCLKENLIVSIEFFFRTTIVIIQRVLIIYWLQKIVFNTLFIVSSMVNFMSVKINKEND